VPEELATAGNADIFTFNTGHALQSHS